MADFVFDLDKAATAERLQEFAEQVIALQAKLNSKQSARGWCYQMEGFRLIDKNQFDKVESWINKCRKEGYLPIDFTLEEEGRQFSGVEEPSKYDPVSFMSIYVNAALHAEDHYCLAKDCFVMTHRGIIRASEVSMQDEVFDQYGRLQKILKIEETKPDVIYEIKVEGGLPLRVTQNHPFLTVDMLCPKHGLIGELKKVDGKCDYCRLRKTPKFNYVWKLAKDITKGTRVLFATPITEFSSHPIIRNEHDAWLLGLYMGDGSKYDKKGLKIMLNENDTSTIQRLKDTLKALGFHYRVWRGPVLRDTHVIVIGFIAPKLRQWINQFHIGESKHIPNELLSINKNLLIGLVQGLVDSDGWEGKRKGTHSIFNKSGSIIQFAALALWKMNITPHLRFRLMNTPFGLTKSFELSWKPDSQSRHSIDCDRGKILRVRYAKKQDIESAINIMPLGHTLSLPFVVTHNTPDWWDGEDCYIQMLVEKIDLKTLFEPVCQKYHIPIATSKGWSSMLQRAVYARRFKEAQDRGLQCVLLYCIPKGEIILTDKGFSNIESVPIGAKVLGKSGFVQVNDVLQREYTGDIINIKATSILPVKVTPEHPIYVTNIRRLKHPKKGEAFRTFIRSDWIDAKDVKVGNYLSFAKPNFCKEDTFVNFDFKNDNGGNRCVHLSPEKMRSGRLKVTKNLARLFGCYMGDGSYSDGGAPTITFHKGDENIVIYTQIIKDELGYEANAREHKDISVQVTQLTFGGSVLGRFLVENFGKYATRKKIPDFILNAKAEIVKSFIQGYIDADGTNQEKTGKIRIATASKGLALQLQLLILDKFGELVSIFCDKREGWIKIQGRDTYQHDKYELHLYSQTINKLWGSKHNGKIGRRKWFEDNGQIYVKITGLNKEKYIGTVYNFVTTDHSICVNNVITHNCGDFDPDGLRISEFIRKNLDDLKTIVWEDGVDGYNPKDLLIIRFGLSYDFIQENKLTWIDNLYTGAGHQLAINGPNGTILPGRTKDGKIHKNFKMQYLQDYLRKYGCRKCEANAIIVKPSVALRLVESQISVLIGDDAVKRFNKKSAEVKRILDEFREKTGMTKSLKKALEQIKKNEKGDDDE